MTVRIPTARRDRRRDDAGLVGAIEMLFLWMIMLAVFYFLVEVTAYWHVRNVLEEAAAQGAQVASAFDGDCNLADAAVRQAARRGGGWTRDLTITCTANDPVRVTVTASSPAILFGATKITVVASTPSVKEQ
jgi:Flp pilus assembly protein TadG